MNERIVNEAVLITGVSSGIGYDAVGYLIEKGYHVFGSVRKAADAERLTREFPKNFTCLIFDVTEPSAVRAGFEIVQRQLGSGGLVGLVNNAGLASGGPMELMDDDKFRYQMEVNLFAVRSVTNTFLPLLKGDKKKGVKGGKIIMISSLSGIFNTPFNGAYCVSKHAVESLAEVYRRELMLYDIDVVSIQSGPIASKLWKKNIGQYEEFDGTDYAPLLKKTNAILEAAEARALPAEVISKLIHRILIRKTPLSFVVNRGWLRTVLFVKFMPARWVDRIFYKKLLT